MTTENELQSMANKKGSWQQVRHSDNPDPSSGINDLTLEQMVTAAISLHAQSDLVLQANRRGLWQQVRHTDRLDSLPG